MEEKNKKYTLYYVFIFFSIVLIFSLKNTVDWYSETFGVFIIEILYTITSPIKGADSSFLKQAVLYGLKRIWILVLIVAVVAVLEFLVRYICLKKTIFNNEKLEAIIIRVWHSILGILVFIAFVLTIKFMDSTIHIKEYLDARKLDTKIYEEEYVSPSSVNIKPSNPKNLICIYVESMETTYADKANGGAQENNYIPNLTDIAYSNINFSNSDLLGGWHEVNGTGWTMGSLYATTTGLPFVFPIDGNSMDTKEKFASGVTAIGDILNENGYYQEFLCGSDAAFAGRDTYYTQHGQYNIYDYFAAVRDGMIPEDYWVFWGFEDTKLYDIAKKRLSEISNSEQPFNYTMLTVDTHHVDGYVCQRCENKYSEQLANVVSCADCQLAEFIEWCRKQDFYKDTVIVICGDHPRMDQSLVHGVSQYDRTVYDVFINVDNSISEKANTKNREFCAMDMYPTILTAIGFEIEGDRLGLGTNLFSDEPTLMEKMGYESLQGEVSKSSSYYVKTFQ